MEVSRINLEALAASINDEIQRSVAAIKQRHLDAGQKASGKTLNSIRGEVTVGTTSLRAIIYGRAPFTDLEVGAGPGGRPSNFYRIILDWMHFKGIHGDPIPYKRQQSERWQPKYTPEDRCDRTLAYFISKKIEEEGTRRYRNESERKDIYSTEVASVVSRIEESLLRVFSMEVDHIHTHSLLKP